MSVLESERVGTDADAPGRTARTAATPRQRSQRNWFILFVLPAVLLYALVLIGPTVFSIGVSLFQWNGLTPPEWRGLRNYEILFRDPVFLRSLVNTLVILFVGGAVIFVVGFFFAAFIRTMRGRNFIRSALFFPFIASPIALSIVWGVLFQYRGIVNTLLGELGIEPLEWLSSENIFKMAVTGTIWVSAGLYLTILLAGIDQIPPMYYEVAELEGASAFQRFRYVTLPLSWDVASVAAILWTIEALKLFDFLFAFGGATTTMPPVEIWNSSLFVYGQTFGDQVPAYRFGYASASAVLMLLLFGVIVVLLRRILRREPIEL
ncbi:carbohydrate ABC transporter permease [Agromyces soli]|uniref:Sugar ABC transporter permease n=1 Tax=Agromyces soli TaxID=659012 RepID=A0ABY4AQ06_9MICO|nr:sugar ABC transporter permease [Agromyces soli]UOE25209.1 sugar ABC transporter permease [Agromyces soli]